MRLAGWSVGLLLAAGIPAGAWAGTEGTASVLRLVVDTTDGSLLIGRPAITSVVVRTSYARLEIPLAQVQEIRIGDDHETAAVELQNGDRLKGVLDLAPLRLETIFGRVSLPVAMVCRLAVFDGDRPRGLVLYFPFCGDAEGTIRDASGKGHAGIAQGAVPTTDRFGRANGAYQFDGIDDCILVPGTADFNPFASPTGTATLATWFRLDRMSDEHTFFGHKESGSGASHNTSWTLKCGVAERAVAFSTVERDTTRLNMEAPALFTAGAWTHIALVRDGTRYTLYLDGQEVKSIQSSSTVSVNGPLRLGFMGDDQKRYMGGALDDVMVFDRALSPAEILRLCTR